jgi:hypothetical protein
MPGLNIAVTILGVTLGCCLLLLLGAFYAKRTNLDSLLKSMGIIAIITIILYVIYVAWYTLTGAK